MAAQLDFAGQYFETDPGERISKALLGFGATILSLRQAYENLEYQRAVEARRDEYRRDALRENRAQLITQARLHGLDVELDDDFTVRRIDYTPEKKAEFEELKRLRESETKLNEARAAAAVTPRTTTVTETRTLDISRLTRSVSDLTQAVQNLTARRAQLLTVGKAENSSEIRALDEEIRGLDEMRSSLQEEIARAMSERSVVEEPQELLSVALAKWKEVREQTQDVAAADAAVREFLSRLSPSGVLPAEVLEQALTEIHRLAETEEEMENRTTGPEMPAEGQEG